MADKQKNLKFLHFRSGNSDYAVELEYVKEIIRSVAVSPMNELPPFAPGVINLRGEIVPIIDFLLRSGAGATTLRLKSRIIITRIHDITAGLLVDDVLETLEVEPSDITRNLHADVLIDVKYIQGTFLSGGTTIVCVDLNKLMTDKEYAVLRHEVKHA